MSLSPLPLPSSRRPCSGFSSHIRAYVTCPRAAGGVPIYLPISPLRPAACSAALPPRRFGVVRRQRPRRERVDRRLHGLLRQVRDVGRRRTLSFSSFEHVVPRVDGVELHADRRGVARRALPGPEAVPAWSDEIRDPRNRKETLSRVASIDSVSSRRRNASTTSRRSRHVEGQYRLRVADWPSAEMP